jgi:60 kDa SS-A/Ro ribonucleoprotein
VYHRNSESEEAQALIAGGLDNVRWDLLFDVAKGPTVWAALARMMGPQALRMNLNTLLQHDVFHVAASLRDADVSLRETDLRDIVEYVADRISDESEIRRGKQLPHQCFAAYLNGDDTVPQ